MRIQCTILPTGRQVLLPTEDGDSISLEKTVQYLSNVTNTLEGAFELFVCRNGSLEALGSDPVTESIYALVRVRGGGKGGFRKQLEKKGREFSRAKAKQDRAKKGGTKSSTRSVKEQRDTARRDKVLVNATKGKASHEEVALSRLLAAQGVTVALNRWKAEAKKN